MWVAPPKGWSSRVFCELPALPRAERQVPKSQPGTEPRALWGPMPPSPLPQPLSLGGFDTMSQKSVIKGSRGQAGTQVTQSPAAEATRHPAGSWNFSQKRTPLRLDSPGSAAPCLGRDTQGGGRSPPSPTSWVTTRWRQVSTGSPHTPGPQRWEPPGTLPAAISLVSPFLHPQNQKPPEKLRNAGTSPFPSGRRGPAGTWDRCAQRKDAAAQAYVPMGQVTKQAGGGRTAWPHGGDVTGKPMSCKNQWRGDGGRGPGERVGEDPSLPAGSPHAGPGRQQQILRRCRRQVTTTVPARGWRRREPEERWQWESKAVPTRAETQPGSPPPASTWFPKPRDPEPTRPLLKGLEKTLLPAPLPRSEDRKGSRTWGRASPSPAAGLGNSVPQGTGSEAHRNPELSQAHRATLGWGTGHPGLRDSLLGRGTDPWAGGQAPGTQPAPKTSLL